LKEALINLMFQQPLSDGTVVLGADYSPPYL
jgi:hypothetical protein